MNVENLRSITKRPILYEKGNAVMWDDEHISKFLLKTHLSQESDLASRKRPAITKTVSWILEQLGKENADILDLGCGPGLYCEIFAEKGHRVTGVDLSKRSIEYAKEKTAENNSHITYICQNYLDISFKEKFDLVVMIFCDFDVLLPDERSRLLENVYAALKPGGVFIFDTMNAKTPEIMNIHAKTWEVTDSGFWKNRPYMALSESFHYESENVILSQTVVCSEPDEYQVYRFWTHYYTYSDLLPILEDKGFSGIICHENLLSPEEFQSGDAVTFYTASKGT
ncbi:class I SAM-dependent methyltransferase [Methanogenium sp. S4BF]|uniref:class I SAM-dependent methyltransferase n=1 Tax=Methanogenium sp. S4BF TaxID=1789226 RepID=UPI00241679E1|nr:class I SAM-dependent methyltransferase [Methanogenium sp. S4BF]WFN33708.1 class I SAM-dependent methyltransferase [Methanogenium sp. S4BF]